MRAFLLEAEKHALFHVDAADRFGRSLLWYAATNGHTEAVRLLLDRGARSSARDMVGWMPLHAACYHGHVDVARLLLERRAEVDARTHAGQTPRWLAHSNAKPGCGAPSAAHRQLASLLAELGGSLGLPPKDWVNPRRPREKPKIPPSTIRCCHEDGERYNIEQLIQAYVHEKGMYTVEECEEYFCKEMHCPPEHHASWHLPVLSLLQPGECKFG